MNLTDRQRDAVEASPGAVFISAAAGSGKTRVLTERFARLVRDGAEPGRGGDLNRVAAVTFTEKAAGELSERIRGALSREGDLALARDVERAWISTIHGLCSRILRRHAFEAGLDPSFKTADEVQAGVLREQAFAAAVRELGAESEAFRHLVTDYDIMRVAEDVRNADEYLRSLGLPVTALVPGEGAGAEEFAAAFLELLARYSTHYETKKDELGVVDFEDLQLRTLSLLEARPAIAEAYRAQFAEVMVDEFQDTNQLQVSVVERLSGGKMSTVGDENQSIYGWRNADVDVFRRRSAEVPPERTLPLPENFRSHPELVAFFNGLFDGEPFWPGAFLRLEVGKRESGDEMGPWPPETPRIRITLLDDEACRSAESPEAEPRAVAVQLAALREAGVPQGDMVVLLRAMSRAEQFADALRAEGLEVFIASGGTYFETREAEELRAILETIANSGNDEAFARLLVGYCANVSDDALLLLRLASDGRSLYEAARDQERPPLPEPDESAVRRLVDALDRARSDQGRVSLYELVHRFVCDLDLDLALLAGGRDRGWANVLKYARLADEFESTAPGDPAALLEYLDVRMRHARYEQQAATAAENVDAVRIMSVHAAKGLEFPVVALAELGKPVHTDTRDFNVGVVGDVVTLGVKLPLGEGVEDKARATAGHEAVAAWQRARELAEAKRLFYVACTRASRALLLFGRMALASQPRERAMDWLTTALDLDRVALAEGDDETHVALGEVAVAVRVIGPPAACEIPAGTQGEPFELRAFEQVAAPDRCEAHQAPERVSFTGLERYRACGYQYYAHDILRLGVTGQAARPGDPRSIGVAVHEALRFVDAARPPDSERTRAIAQRMGLGAADSNRVESAVRAFAGTPIAAEAYAGERVAHEVPFALQLGGTILDGNIDLISWRGTEATIVDYKTGARAVPAAAPERWRRQAECYALAALRAGASQVRVAFVQLETGAAEEVFAFSRPDAGALESEILATIGRIASGAFEPLDAFSSQTCPGCPALGNLCPVSPPRHPGGAA